MSSILAEEVIGFLIFGVTMLTSKGICPGHKTVLGVALATFVVGVFLLSLPVDIAVLAVLLDETDLVLRLTLSSELIL